MSGTFNNENSNQKNNINNMKKNLTLDFSQKKTLNVNNAVLSSPDLNMLKVNTPDLEKMLMNGLGANTPTPSLLFPKPVTEEQESFATGFVNALNNLHNSNSSNDSTVYDLDQTNINFMVKEEPQTVPNISSPPVSPVDMEDQERLKLERKRQRNRLAASKCRSRKLERISKLEDKVKMLKTENTDLTSLINQLKEQVGLLKVEVMNHCNAGCHITI